MAGKRANRAEWRRRISRWEKSKEPARVFAAREGVGEKSLYWWRRKLLEEDEASSSVAFVRLEPSTEAPAPSAVEIVVSDVTVRVSGGFDSAVLSRVVDVLVAR